MKKIVRLLVLPLLIGSMVFSCATDDNGNFGSDPESGWVEFPGVSSTISVDNALETISVPISFTAPINRSPLTITYTIQDITGSSSDAINASGSVTIPADSNQTNIELNVLPTAANALVSSDISFDVVLQSADRGVAIGLSDGSSTTAHRVNLVCDLTLDIGGTYNVTTTYGYHDFLPSFNPNTTTMNIVDNGDGTFFVQDFSGGLYNGGPYTTAYGTGPTSMDVTFFNSCNKIQWENQSDPWGAIIPLSGGVNEVDINTGVVTISWFCEGYGENGVSVYTPL